MLGTDPITMLTGPVDVTPIIMKRAETRLDEMDFIEINEAFSTVVKAACYELKLDWHDPRYNQWGGAIAIGHPTGMTGTRLVGTLIHQLEESKKKYGFATLCVGLGMGMGAIVKKRGVRKLFVLNFLITLFFFKFLIFFQQIYHLSPNEYTPNLLKIIGFSTHSLFIRIMSVIFLSISGDQICKSNLNSLLTKKKKIPFLI
jgi:hypothetical protein